MSPDIFRLARGRERGQRPGTGAVTGLPSFGRAQIRVGAPGGRQGAWKERERAGQGIRFPTLLLPSFVQEFSQSAAKSEGVARDGGGVGRGGMGRGDARVGGEF